MPLFPFSNFASATSRPMGFSARQRGFNQQQQQRPSIMGNIGSMFNQQQRVPFKPLMENPPMRAPQMPRIFEGERPQMTWRMPEQQQQIQPQLPPWAIQQQLGAPSPTGAMSLLERLRASGPIYRMLGGQ